MPPSAQSPYDEAVSFLFALQGFGVKLGLTNVSRFLRELQSPQHSFPVVHIAGSNGKGSTAAFLASILTEAGYRTALYTSPHLVDFRERMRVQGRPIPERFVTSWVTKHRHTIRRRKLTFFEATTALAFDWFRARDVDIAVIETGLGGRLDATNVLDPLLTIITSVSREHTHILGNDLLSIAREKAGIAKQGVPCVLGTLNRSTDAFLRTFLRTNRVPLVRDASLRVSARTGARGRTSVDISSRQLFLKKVTSGLPGKHQARNIRTVIQAVQVLRSAYALHIGDEAVRRGVERVEPNTRLLARCAPVRGHRNLFADVAHNPEAMKLTTKHFGSMVRGKSWNIIFGIASDKDVRSVLRHLRPIAKHITVVAAKSPRSRTASSILKLCRALSIPADGASSVHRAIRSALQRRNPGNVLITGSHFVVGEALASLRRRKYLTITQ